MALTALATAAGYPITPATAASAEQELQEIVITGSILRRADAQTPSPVSVMTADDLQQRGINTVAEAMQRLSANGSGTMTQGWNNGSNFASGASAVSLRGLTVQATLVIFDGLRMAPFPLADDGHRNFVDLNTLPHAVLERIEVLKDGASCTYGADAIAGVVNVITRKELTGLHVNVAGAFTAAGGTERRADLAWGTRNRSDRGYNAYGAVEYQKQDAIRTSDRGYPFNSNDKTGICDDQGHCLANRNQFGIDNRGALAADTTTTIPIVAPATGNSAASRVGPYQLLNAPAGCSLEPGLKPVTLTAAQQLFVGGVATYAAQQCQQDLRKQFQVLQSRSAAARS